MDREVESVRVLGMDKDGVGRGGGVGYIKCAEEENRKLVQALYITVTATVVTDTVETDTLLVRGLLLNPLIFFYNNLIFPT